MTSPSDSCSVSSTGVRIVPPTMPSRDTSLVSTSPNRRNTVLPIPEKRSRPVAASMKHSPTAAPREPRHSRCSRDSTSTSASEPIPVRNARIRMASALASSPCPSTSTIAARNPCSTSRGERVVSADDFSSLRAHHGAGLDAGRHVSELRGYSHFRIVTLVPRPRWDEG